MKPIEPDFHKCRGRYSKTACRDNKVIDHRPIDAQGDQPKPEPQGEEGE